VVYLRDFLLFISIGIINMYWTLEQDATSPSLSLSFTGSSISSLTQKKEGNTPIKV